MGVTIGYDNALAHWIEAGADFFIMPSIYEPCGLNQLYSLKYGTLPIVRATGGLNDTVAQYDEATGDGTGFKFWEPSARAIFYTAGWAVSTYYDRPEHMRRMVQTAMLQDYSWSKSAGGYLELYERALANKARESDDRSHRLQTGDCHGNASGRHLRMRTPHSSLLWAWAIACSTKGSRCSTTIA